MRSGLSCDRQGGVLPPDSEAEGKQRTFWKTVIRAAEAEPRDATRIPGATGIDHPVLAAGVDEGRRRLIVISGEADARLAALGQADIEAATGLHVIMVRPIVATLATVGQALQTVTGRPEIDLKALGELLQPSSPGASALFEPVKAIFQQFEFAKVNIAAQIFQLLQQLAKLSFHPLAPSDPSNPSATLILRDLDKLAASDPTAEDRAFGVCPFPLFRLSAEYAEILQHGDDVESAQEALRRLDIFQYFFPPPDQVALAAVDRGTRDRKALEKTVAAAPTLGHPFGPNEVVATTTKIGDLIDELKERGYVAEGEVELSVTDTGKEVRSKVKFAPRESFASKLMNRISVGFNLGDLLKK
jgi:hypothetical protein